MPMPTDTSPAISDTRVPHITRASTSRPMLSVPSRWAPLGGASSPARSCLSGSYGARAGANTAISTTAKTTIPPKAAKRAVSARRAKSHRLAGGSGAIANARIEPTVDNVDNQVAEYETDSNQQDDALHQGIIARKHCIDHEASNTG